MMPKSASISAAQGADRVSVNRQDVGLFIERLSSDDFAGRPALFLDRDGVIVEESHYLHRPDDVKMIDGVAKAIARANRASIPVVIVTNQAGIGRGYYQWADFHAVQQHIYRELAKAGAKADVTAACAYHQDGVGAYAQAGHLWRKPRPGMLLEAAGQLKIDVSNSYIVGDCLSDLEAGARAGLRRGALVQSGHGQREWESGGLQAFEMLEKNSNFIATISPSASVAIESWLGEFPS